MSMTRNTAECIIMPDSSEAASIRTVTGWVSRTGRFWGDDEHMARYDGSTHRVCECGEIIEQRSYCMKCSERRERDRYLAMPAVAWDGVSPLNIHGTDTYFFDTDSLLDHCFYAGCQPKDLPLVVCVPQYAETIDANDYYSDDLPDEGEVPSEIDEAFRELNAKIKACATPLCWYPGKQSITPESLPTLGSDGA